MKISEYPPPPPPPPPPPSRRSLVVEVPESPGFFTNHHGTTRTPADVSTVLLRLMPMHHDLINRGESKLRRGQNRDSVTGALDNDYKYGLDYDHMNGLDLWYHAWLG